MQNVPKIVRERLKAAASAVDHPDADVLTAFAERSLTELERAVVLEHLARCGDCRDIMALALPAPELAETAVRPSPTGWLAWPALRWGLVAAGVIAIASVGILQHQWRTQSATMALKTYARPEAASTEAKNQPPPAPVTAAPAQPQSKIQASPAATDSLDRGNAAVAGPNQIASSEASQARTLPPQLGHGTGAGVPPRGFPHGPKMAMQWQQQNANALQVQAPTPAAPGVAGKQQAGGEPFANGRVPSASEAVEVQAQAVQINRPTENREARVEDQFAAQPSSGEDYTSTKVDKAKPAVTTQAAAAPASALMTPKRSQAPVGGPLALSVPIPRWTISSAGSLQRSFDQGSTWQDVDVKANSASVTGAASLEVTVKTSRAKGKDADKKLLKEPAAALTFRAVAAAGPDVWAGGSQGLLYHSLDAGDHWARVVPSADGTLLTGDIISLEFPDMQHCKVSTSTAEVWTTSDDGQTWQKQ